MALKIFGAYSLYFWRTNKIFFIFLCAKKNKPHSIAEKLVKTCAIEMAKTLLGLRQKKNKV